MPSVFRQEAALLALIDARAPTAVFCLEFGAVALGLGAVRLAGLLRNDEKHWVSSWMRGSGEPKGRRRYLAGGEFAMGLRGGWLTLTRNRARGLLYERCTSRICAAHGYLGAETAWFRPQAPSFLSLRGDDSCIWALGYPGVHLDRFPTHAGACSVAAFLEAVVFPGRLLAELADSLLLLLLLRPAPSDLLSREG